MLSITENLFETVRGGSPDRFVNQFEFFQTVREPILDQMLKGNVPGQTSRGEWGVVVDWPAGQPGPIPNTRGDAKVIKDIARWQDYVNETNRPRTSFTPQEWAPALAEAETVRASGRLVAVSLSSGVFEKIHNLMGMTEALEAFYTYPDEMHQLFTYMMEHELAGAREVCDHMSPDVLFHPDDFGSSLSTFVSPAMFAEFFVPVYREIYGYWRSRGVKLIIHHSDSYGATLVPQLLKMGVDIWQGALAENDIPALLETYKGQLTFMGGINSSHFDTPDFRREEADEYILSLCRRCGKRWFIPCLTQGGPKSVYPGVYDAVSDSIRRASQTVFNS